MDDWSIGIGSDLHCGDSGIMTIELGGNKGILNDEYRSSAPLCDHREKRLNDLNVPGLDMGKVDMQKVFITPTGAFASKPVATLFQYDAKVGLSRLRT